MKPGIELIAFERQRQIEKEGWSIEHDDRYEDNELAEAAVCYAIPPKVRDLDKDGDLVAAIWPWDWEWWKPTPENRIKELVKAGALIAAEIDRLQRMEANNGR